jgi:hypothetical protein
MLVAERRGDYDAGRSKDALTVRDANTDVRLAIFLDESKSMISIAVDMPNKSGVLCYSVDFDVMIDFLRSRTLIQKT